MRLKRLKWSTLLPVLSLIYLNGGNGLTTKDADIRDASKFKPRANIILITISSSRADHTGCFGYQRDTTPNFDTFCKNNMLFLNAFATSSWAMPTHGSIFTSLYPRVHGATHIDKSLNGEWNTLAEMLAAIGYYCVGFCCNPRLSAERGFAQGFDFYDDYSVEIVLSCVALEGTESFDINKQRTNDLINDAAIRWLQNNTHKPFFMFLHYYDNHWDYLPPEPYNKLYGPDYQGSIDGTAIAREPLFSNPPDEKDIEQIIALYDGEVKQTDNDLGEMLTFLKSSGLMADSIVIVMGDHGEQFYEHGNTSHHGTFEELIHIPLAVSIPNKSKDARKVNSLVSQLDILPTILDYLELPVPDRCQGRSLKPVIEGKKKSVHDFIFAEYTGGTVPESVAVRSARYKYIEQESESFMYDLAGDPREQGKILPHNFGQEVLELQKSLRQWRKSTSTDNRSG